VSDYFSAPLPGAGQRPAPVAPPAWPAQQPPAYAPVSSAPPSYPPPGYQPGAPAWPTPTVSTMSVGMKVLIAIASVIGGFILLGILAAIAIPVFLNQRAKAEAAATSVSIPTQVVGLARLTDARSLQVEQQLRQQPGQPAVGVYGVNGSVRATVAVSRQAMSGADDAAFLQGAERGFQNQGVGQVFFTAVDAGRLRGLMRCATVVSPQFSVCVFADHGAFGSISLYGSLTGRTDVALSIREAVEHRS
jgi:hypothetical protein